MVTSGRGPWLCGLPGAHPGPSPPPTSCQTAVATVSPFTAEDAASPGSLRQQVSGWDWNLGHLSLWLPPSSQGSDLHAGNRGVCVLEAVQVGEKGEMAIQWEISTDIPQKNSQKQTFYFIFSKAQLYSGILTQEVFYNEYIVGGNEIWT